MKKIILTSLLGISILTLGYFMFEMYAFTKGIVDEIGKRKPNTHLEKVPAIKKLSNFQIDSLALEIEKRIQENQLKKYIYPEMSFCGGAVTGYYQDSNLVLIDATFSGDNGFSNRKIYLEQESIIKIEYREHFGDTEKYFNNYPLEKFEFDPARMTYTDTIYKISLGQQLEIQKLFDEKLIEMPIDSALLRKLIKCGLQMKNDLERDKQLEE